jgi:5-methylcytosine-specific restriction protein A
MANRAYKQCLKFGCRNITNDSTGYCIEHIVIFKTMQEDKDKQKAVKDKERLNSYQRGYNKRWQAYRLEFLKDNPYCVECLKFDIHTAANEVDHIIPFKGDYDLFWNYNNHQSLCKICHSKKTRKEINKGII